MKVFVTGGAGFIGSNFCDFVLAQQQVEKLYILDKFTYAGLRENLLEALSDDRTELLEGDICEAAKFTTQINDSDIVFNFAAESHVDNSISGPEEFVQTNIFGTFKLLEVIRSSKNNIRFIQISTDEVYGSLTFEAPASTVKDTLNPSSPYSASKAGADHLALSYHKTYGLEVLITRSTNNFGPRQLVEKLIPKVIDNSLGDQKIPVYGNGLNTRDWIYVGDNCAGVWAAGLSGKPGQTYHLGSGNEVSNIDIVKQILKLLSKPESLIEFVDDRLGHDLRYSLNTEQTQKELNWQCDNSFNKQLEQTIDWYQENSTWILAANNNLKKR